MLSYKCVLTKEFMAATVIVGETEPQELGKMVWQKYFLTDCLKKLEKNVIALVSFSSKVL